MRKLSGQDSCGVNLFHKSNRNKSKTNISNEKAADCAGIARSQPFLDLTRKDVLAKCWVHTRLSKTSNTASFPTQKLICGVVSGLPVRYLAVCTTLLKFVK